MNLFYLDSGQGDLSYLVGQKLASLCSPQISMSVFWGPDPGPKHGLGLAIYPREAHFLAEFQLLLISRLDYLSSFVPLVEPPKPPQ